MIVIPILQLRLNMTKDEFLKHFSYNQLTGEFKRLGRRNGHGSIDAYGYLVLKIKGAQYKAHRMAWLCVYGNMPDGNVDHINRIRSDNRIDNLRCISQAENNRNLTVKPNEKTGVKGVYIDNTKGLKKKYTINIQGKRFRFANVEDASEFRDSKLKEKGYGNGHF